MQCRVLLSLSWCNTVSLYESVGFHFHAAGTQVAGVRLGSSTMHRSLCRFAKLVQSVPQAGCEANCSGRSWVESAYASSARCFHSGTPFCAQSALAENADTEQSELEPAQFLSSSRRTGVIAVKVGMTQAWDKWSMRIPLTVLWLDNCQVSQYILTKCRAAWVFITTWYWYTLM